jgi:hypothetical protein
VVYGTALESQGVIAPFFVSSTAAKAAWFPTQEVLMIDYTPVTSGQQKIADLAADISLDDLKTTTNEQIDSLVMLLRDLSDAQIVFVASDPQAEGGVGWNVAHLIAHSHRIERGKRSDKLDSRAWNRLPV